MALKSIPFFRDYKLRYDWEAYENMVEGLGTPSFIDFAQIIEKLGPKQIRIILWAGLLHMNPGLTPKDIFPILDEYLSDHSLEELTDIVVKALQEASILSKMIGGPDQGEVASLLDAKQSTSS